MNKLPIYISAPSVKHAEKKVNNEFIINKVQENFRGSKNEWRKIKTGISYVLKYCNSQSRFFGLDESKTPIDYAVDAAKDVCKVNNILPKNIDLLIYGGIYREYFEPATSMEIASKLGLKKVAAFDVLDACAGLMQSIQVATSMMQTNENINYALCCTTDFAEDAINYDIQHFDELATKSAGLTLGSGASAWLITREPVGIGGARLIDIKNTSYTSSYSICKVPVKQKKFHSQGKEIFDLGIKYVPEEIKDITNRINWAINDIDFFISHQPSKKVINDICDIIGISYDKAPVIHHLFGNTINSSIPMAMDHIINNIGMKNGNKLLFNSAAAGFSMVTAAAIWEENNE